MNDPPYGSESAYNAMRLAGSLCRASGEAGQKVPEGIYSLCSAKWRAAARRSACAEPAWTRAIADG